ncbi:MAG: hypothetical protein ACR2QQ_06545 [Gammaproteobacteria bacterium]
MTLTVIVGFWPSYYGPLTQGTTQVSWILHFHGVIYMGWMGLFIAQTVLAASGRIGAHRSVGSVGIGYGITVLIVGVLVSFIAPVMHVNAGEWTIDQAATFLPIPLGDMVLFGGLFGAAVAYRQKPEIHKRLMLLATVALLFAAVFRLWAAGWASMPAAIFLWYVPVILGIAYDGLRQGRVPPVYWIGAAAMSISLLKLPLGTTGFWLGFGGRIIESLS